MRHTWRPTPAPTGGRRPLTPPHKKPLARIGRNLEDVGAILLNHGHADLPAALRSVVRDRGIPVFAAPGSSASPSGEDGGPERNATLAA